MAYKTSKEFAYILGVIYGDGSYRLRKDKRGTSGAITLKVKDKDFALNFKKIIEKWSGIKAKYYVNEKNEHLVGLYSIDASRIVDNFNLHDVLSWNKRFQYEFLRGLFDSDEGGCWSKS